MPRGIYQIEGVSFRYETDWVLREVGLDIEPGGWLGILGPNGSGKSTLLKVMASLLQPQAGTVTLLDRPLARWSRRELARVVGMVPQESFFLYPYSVMEVVLMGRHSEKRAWEFDSPADLAIGQAVLDQVGLLSYQARSIHALSGGERQRVVIARALAQQPKVLLLDEPTAFLDLHHQLQIYRILKQLSREAGISLVVVSHDLNLAAQFCDRVVVLNHGELVRMGTPEEVLTTSLIEEIYGCQTLVDAHPVTGKPRITLIPE